MLAIVEKRYAAGHAGYLEVLDAQRSHKRCRHRRHFRPSGRLIASVDLFGARRRLALETPAVGDTVCGEPGFRPNFSGSTAAPAQSGRALAISAASTSAPPLSTLSCGISPAPARLQATPKSLRAARAGNLRRRQHARQDHHQQAGQGQLHGPERASRPVVRRRLQGSAKVGSASKIVATEHDRRQHVGASPARSPTDCSTSG